MVYLSGDQLDRVFHALSDPTRRKIVRSLAERSSGVTEIARSFEGVMSLPAVSKHIRVLESADLVRRSIEGRVHRCSLNVQALRAVENWIEPYGRFWHERLDALEEVIIGGDQQ